MTLLEIKNLEVSVENTNILKGVNLSVNKGEIHAIMGPNGSGKSSLSKTLIGHHDYYIDKGEIVFDGENLIPKTIEERSRAGLFLGFQYPVEVPGINNADFLRLAYNSKLASEGKDEIDAFDFMELLKEKMELLKIREDFTERALNEGFSGGEKKKNEKLQMAILDPKLIILDEIDSGLDIDSLKIVAEGVNALMNKDKALILVTHYQRLLNFIQPTHVHVMLDGQIRCSGDKTLALELEKSGYDFLRMEAKI